MSGLEQIETRNAGVAASVALHDYVSDRSVALLLRSDAGGLRIGSGTCIAFGKRLFIATVGHNLTGLKINQVEVRPSGNNRGVSIPILGMSHQESPDLGWIEIDVNPEVLKAVKTLDVSQIATLKEIEDRQTVLVQGFPADQVITNDQFSAAHPHVRSSGILTLLIPQCERSDTASGTDFSVEYPPWDESIDETLVPIPQGKSGGGVWLVLPFQSKTLWTTEDVRLVGLVQSSKSKTKELFCLRIEYWLSFVRNELPELFHRSPLRK